MDLCFWCCSFSWIPQQPLTCSNYLFTSSLHMMLKYMVISSVMAFSSRSRCPTSSNIYTSSANIHCLLSCSYCSLTVSKLDVSVAIPVTYMTIPPLTSPLLLPPVVSVFHFFRFSVLICLPIWEATLILATSLIFMSPWHSYIRFLHFHLVSHTSPVTFWPLHELHASKLRLLN